MSAALAASVAERFPVRVMVTPVWDTVVVPVDAGTTVAQLKHDALVAALKRAIVDEQDYVVKFRGAAVLDEAVTLGTLGAGPNAPFIVLPARRQPVR
ncbi:MAG TPA: hypothetical protein VN908_05035 [Gemmatimonadales bacterium]|nr:hypothetical protein [Gemmatimonadales bacterium]